MKVEMNFFLDVKVKVFLKSFEKISIFEFSSYNFECVSGRKRKTFQQKRIFFSFLSWLMRKIHSINSTWKFSIVIITCSQWSWIYENHFKAHQLSLRMFQFFNSWTSHVCWFFSTLLNAVKNFWCMWSRSFSSSIRFSKITNQIHIKWVCLLLKKFIKNKFLTLFFRYSY